MLTINYSYPDIKADVNASKALKSRKESGLNNLPYDQNGERCYSIFLDDKRRKMVIVVRAYALQDLDFLKFATDSLELFASTSAADIGLL